MSSGKYIIIKHRGHEVPILFHPIMEHDMFYLMFVDKLIISAGFFETYPNQDNHDEIYVSVYGHSISLDKQHRKEDAQLIKELLKGK